MIHIGMIGAGAWGRNLMRNVASHKEAVLEAVCDPDAEALSFAQAHYPQAAAYATIEQLLDHRRLDAVIVASPPRLHFAHARRALSAGLHVLVEKPLSTTSEDARALVELAVCRRRVLMAGHTFLYSNLVDEVKHRIDGGELGEVYCVSSQRLNLGRIRTDVDALWNFAPHDLSIAAYLLGEWPTKVNARGACFIRKRDNVADMAFFQLDFASGRLFSGHVSWLHPQKTRRMVVVGSERMLVYDDMDADRHIQVFDKRVEVAFQAAAPDFCDFRTKIRAGDLFVPSIRLVEPLSVEIGEFVGCIRTGRQPKTDGAQGLAVVCVLEALSRSMRMGGASVDVDYSMPLQQVHRRMPASARQGLAYAPPPAPATAQVAGAP